MLNKFQIIPLQYIMATSQMVGIIVHCITWSSLPLESHSTPKEPCPLIALVLHMLLWPSGRVLPLLPKYYFFYSASSAKSPWPSPCRFSYLNQCFTYWLLNHTSHHPPYIHSSTSCERQVPDLISLRSSWGRKIKIKISKYSVHTEDTLHSILHLLFVSCRL